MGRYAEMGVNGVVVPHVSPAAEARILAHAMRSKPAASLIVILESLLGATNAEEILGIEGIDGAFVGPINLSTDVGRRGDYGHPLYESALSRIERAAASMDKVLGTVPNEGYSVDTLIRRGHRLFILGSDRAFARKEMLARVADMRTMSDKQNDANACDA